MTKPSPSGKESIAAALFYLLCTVAFLWFAVRPADFSTNLQTLDSVLAAQIADHVAHAPFHSDTAFWDFEIFYPLQKTLCLSEPMITNAIIMAPLIWLWNWVAAFNFYIYVCWWSLAMAAWWYLRLRGASPLAALWAGLFISFSPDRSWHLAGHAHLYYQTGLFLALIGLDRYLSGGSSRWRLLYTFGILSQLFAGFYITVIVAAWSVVVIPVAAYLAAASTGQPALSVLLRRGKFLLIAPVVSLLLFAPILKGYSDFGKNRAQNSLEFTIPSSATLAGYLVPPTDPGRLVTPGGRIVIDRMGTRDHGEDSQYIGIIAPTLFIAGLAMAAGASQRRHAHMLAYCAAVAGGGLVCLVLSFGPTWNHAPIPAPRLPFAYLYGWFEPLRFFRSPSRFAFGVQWSIGILGSLALTALSAALRSYGLPRAASNLGLLCLAVTVIDFYPSPTIPRYSVEESAISRWLSSQEEPKPYVIIPVDDNGYLSQFGWNHTRVANGYSGYAPENRLQELAAFESSFPGSASLAAMGMWQINRAFVPPDRATAAISSGNWRPIWTDPSGVMLELTTSTLTLEAYRQTLPHESPTRAATLRPVDKGRIDNAALDSAGVAPALNGMVAHPQGGFHQNGPVASLLLTMKEPLPTTTYVHLRMRYRISNWYKLNESGAIYWNTTDNPAMGEKQKIEFILHGDSQWHEITIPLDKSLAWLASAPASTLRIDLGARLDNHIEIDWMELR